MISIVTNNREVLLDPVGTRVVGYSVLIHGSAFSKTFPIVVEWMDHPAVQLCIRRHGCPRKGTVRF